MCSAGDTEVVVAVTNNLILFFFKNFTSTLSNPTPCLDITFSFLHFSNISASILPLRKVIPSKAGSLDIKFFF